jgi:hypothetical protein
MKSKAENKNLLTQLKEKHPQNDGFIVPDRYFDQLSSQISGRIKNEVKQPQKTITEYRLLIPLAAAASLILFFAIYYQNQQGRQSVQNSSSANNNAIETAVDESYVNDLMTEDYKQAQSLLENLDEDEINFVDKPLISEDITEESILEFLNEQELDPSLLAEL